VVEIGTGVDAEVVSAMVGAEAAAVLMVLQAWDGSRAPLSWISLSHPTKCDEVDGSGSHGEAN
jgi:hypothetical protein